MPIRWSPRPLQTRLASTQRRGQNLSERYRKLENAARDKSEHDVPPPNGLRVLAPTKPPDTIAGFVIPKLPRAPAEDECCMSGCAVCVYDLYEDALATYKEEVAALRAALAEQDIPETEWPVHIRTGGGPTAPRATVLDAFEEMERALKAKRAAVEAEKRRKEGTRLDLGGLYEAIKWIMFSSRYAVPNDESSVSMSHRCDDKWPWTVCWRRMERADHHHQSRGRGRGRRRPPTRQPNPGSRQPPDTTSDGGPQRQTEQPIDAPSPSPTVTTPSQTPRPSRRSRFRATLTTTPEPPQVSASAPRRPRPRRSSPLGDDLTSTLTRALRTPPFPDCPICFNPIRPEHPTWSCSPPATMTDKTDAEEDKAACCWNTFHLKCIRAWAEKSVKELEEAWRARGEMRPGEWRCPGCRATRQAVPQTYMCFCLRMRHPAPPRIATPHSCAQPCSRPRSGCNHACPLPCHPGPCPPCAVTIQVKCFCGEERHSAKCQVGLTASSFSCSQPCRRPLSCGKAVHLCAETCHEGPCLPCPEREEVRCWCGRETKQVGCGEVKVEETAKCVVVENDGSEQEWVGGYECSNPCGRPFACTHHSCSKTCHPPSRIPPPCPFDPERVVSCACGRCRIARSPDELVGNGPRPTSTLLPLRSSCRSPLPTCTAPCSKPLPCGHLCQVTCHWGPCPPCTEQVERTCRCGATKHKSPCSESVITQRHDDVAASAVILCDKPCTAQRTCGRHQCGRVCCPLASLLRTAKSLKRRDVSIDPDAQLQFDPTLRALHECDLPCGRVLPCGNHRCERGDHRGQCGVCPRGVFEELVCPCGRTVLEPPIQCGTRLRCVYPCARPPPVCGHPHVAHACHEGAVVAGADTADDGLGLGAERESGGGNGLCPPCPFLTEKVCACGKKRVSNVRCSQERVSCGSVCGKLLACGFHHCERLCHADVCGSCTAVCGKSRKSCLPAHHPCTLTCHAPATCPETEPCLSPVMLTCPCGHLRSTVPCSGTKLALACAGECEIKKRNARLAEALGIREENREPKGGRVTWSSELVSGARSLGPKFVGVVEKAFADFVASDRRTQMLPHMPPDRRKFVHDLASVYRMDTVMVDQEPHRSVQLIRRIDTRSPVPLLSQNVASTIGRLVVGKTGVGTGAAWGGGNTTGPATGVGGTGAGKWNAVVTKTALGAPSSGSATPIRVPSPAAGVRVREREGSPGPSRSTGESKSAWVSPTVQAQRAKENAAPEDQVAAEATQSIPDNWEDDI